MLIQVYINDRTGRRKVSAELIKRNKKTLWVQREGGRIIKRKIDRDLA